MTPFFIKFNFAGPASDDDGLRSAVSFSASPTGLESKPVIVEPRMTSLLLDSFRISSKKAFMYSLLEAKGNSREKSGEKEMDLSCCSLQFAF